MKDKDMERQKLKETLAELHQELAASPDEIDDETKTLLKQLATDIDHVCVEDSADSEEKSPVVPEKKEGLLDQLLDLTKEFEESHPQLADVIGRVATAFSRIGI